ncbi:MAG: heavy metal-binding domain-containing protein [Acidobacteriota bacterium]
MNRSVWFAAAAVWILAGILLSQQVSSQRSAKTTAGDTIWMCPMDPDVRSHEPGKCPRCGMKLATGLPEPVEYHMDLSTLPAVLRASQPFDLAFAIHDPWKDRPVTKFQVVHEKLFHMFVVGQDLEFFLHDHPVFSPDGQFHYQNLTLPEPGMYRVLGDFFPDASTPQMITRTLLVPGTPPPAVTLTQDYSTKVAENLKVEFSTVPEHPIAGSNTQLHFKLSPGDGFEPYLGTWGHLLATSDDLIDKIHTHPFIADGGPEVQFNVVFPRPGHAYRVWVQFQRKGVVNTAHFDVKADDLH